MRTRTEAGRYMNELFHSIVVLSFKFHCRFVLQPVVRMVSHRLGGQRCTAAVMHWLGVMYWCTRGVNLYWKKQTLDDMNLLACTGEHTAGGSTHAGLACTGLTRLPGQTAEPSAGRQQRRGGAVADASTASAAAAAAAFQPGTTPPAGLQLKPLRRSPLHIFTAM